MEEISINPFVHFPYISVSLHGIEFYESTEPGSSMADLPIVRLETAYLSFDFTELLKSKLELERISAYGGSVHLVQLEDGSFNIANALMQTSSTQTGAEHEARRPSGSNTKSETNVPLEQAEGNVHSDTEFQDQNAITGLNIEEMMIREVDIEIDMIPSDQKQIFSILQSEASFRYVNDSIEGEMISSFKIERLGINKNHDIEDEELFADLDFYYDRGDSILNVRKTEIEFNNAILKTDGIVNLKEKGHIDMRFAAHDEALTFTRLFLTPQGIEHLRSGQFFLNGQVKGDLYAQIPNFSCDFGATKVNIEIPNTREYLRNLNFQGRFNSGNRGDLSQAILEIDTVHADLPSGEIRASSTVRNFKDPNISYDLDISFQLQNLAKFIDLGPVKNLRGHLKFKDEYEGELSNSLTFNNSGKEEFIIGLDSVSFDIPDVIDVDFLQGTLAGNIDTLDIDSLLIRSKASDILINGSLYKLSNAIFEKDTLVQADLNIRSNSFDFPMLFRALPKTAASFPYVVRDLNLDVRAEASFYNLENFDLVPEMNFDLPRVHVRVDSLLNAVELRDGRFTMRERDSMYSLNFTNFKILSGYEPTEADFSYVRRPTKQDSMNFRLRAEDLKPYQIFDSTDEILSSIKDTELSGEYDGYIVRSNNGDRLIKKVGFKASKVSYISRDTIEANRVDFNANDISYKRGSVDTLWATLKSKNRLQFQNLSSSLIQLDSLKMSISTHNGIIDITPEELDFLGESDTANISINVIEDPMRFDLEYSVDDLPIDDILNSLYDQELLTGSVDVRLDIQSAGNDLETIQNYLGGSIFIAGDSLKLMGVDLDKFIKEFQKSQTFNLVDIGAMVLVGPAGILYTKGSDYLVLLGSDKGDTTRISRVNSQWQLDRGRIETQDVAFATLKNRVAMEGWLDLSTDSLDITIAVINKRGCAIVDQRIYGDTNEPEYSSVNIFETLLAPVTNAVKGVVGAECKVFYNGNVLHPDKSDTQK